MRRHLAVLLASAHVCCMGAVSASYPLAIPEGMDPRLAVLKLFCNVSAEHEVRAVYLMPTGVTVRTVSEKASEGQDGSLSTTAVMRHITLDTPVSSVRFSADAQMVGRISGTPILRLDTSAGTIVAITEDGSERSANVRPRPEGGFMFDVWIPGNTEPVTVEIDGEWELRGIKAADGRGIKIVEIEEDGAG